MTCEPAPGYHRQGRLGPCRTRLLEVSMRCSRCQQENPAGVKFCGECGTPFQRLVESIQPPSYADVQRSLTEALEQQTATSEILRVISNSPADYQPVFDTIVRTAGAVCGAVDAVLWTMDGDELVIRAHHGPLPGDIGSRQPIHGSVAGYAVHEARLVHVEDLTEADDFPFGRDLARRLGWRTTLSAPLLREGVAIGAILIRRSEVRPFTDKQIALLKTFADQAAIAIENVRLFGELQEKNRALTLAHRQVTEALEQQTATSEILRVIESSPIDVQPVFDTIVRSAKDLCGALFGALARFDGELVHFVAQHNFPPAALDEVPRIWPTRPSRASGAGRAILDRAVVQIPDIELDPEYGLQRLSRAVGHRSSIYVPMLRNGVPIGVIVVARAEAGLFSTNHVELLKTFADQAVIAIENARLFTELEARNRDLTEALEQQTATSEILRVISSSPTDVQPVFETILRLAAELCGAHHGSLFRFDGVLLHVAVHHNVPPPTR